MSRAKTIALFALIGPAAAAVPFLLTILTLAAFHRDAQRIGIAVAALFMAYVYGLIPWGFPDCCFHGSWAAIRMSSIALLPLRGWERLRVFSRPCLWGLWLFSSPRESLFTITPLLP